MKRLTERVGENGRTVIYVGEHKQYNDGDIPCEISDAAKREILKRLADYEDTGTEPEEVLSALEMSKIFAALEELKEYQKAEQEGRLIVLPCKIGDTVYGIICGSVVEGVVYNLEYENIRGIESITVSLIYDYGACRGNIVGGDVTVFLNREEAEAALEGVKTDG